MTDRRSSRLYISNLSPSCNQSELKALFEKVGAVTSLSCTGDIAYLEFENPEHATTAIEKFDNYKFEGSRILVEFALKTRNFHRGGRGGFRGGSDRERDLAAGRCFKCNEKGHIAKYSRAAAGAEAEAGNRKNTTEERVRVRKAKAFPIRAQSAAKAGSLLFLLNCKLQFAEEKAEKQEKRLFFEEFVPREGQEKGQTQEKGAQKEAFVIAACFFAIFKNKNLLFIRLKTIQIRLIN